MKVGGFHLKEPGEAPAIRVVAVDQLPRYDKRAFSGGFPRDLWDGESYAGGYGARLPWFKDYWTLRQRSADLFERNMYGRGLIRRLITNEINTGLGLECAPEESILGKEEGDLDEWTDDVESRFGIWAQTPTLCDAKGMKTFGGLQATIRREALIGGDVLVVNVQDRRTKLPRIRIIAGEAISTPAAAKPRKGNRIEYGVELDPQDRQVAYWVCKRDGSWKRLPAVGEKSGRRLAWLVYGTDKREHEVRGTPLLGLILQMLREVDRYKDATLRKAVVNSMLAMFIQKDEERAGTRALTGGAVRRGTAVAQTDDGPRQFDVTGHIPGMVIEELEVGEKPVGFGSQGIDEKFGDFEEAMVASIAWANEIPMEILTLKFSNNYSASQAAINEFKMYLTKVRTDFGVHVCVPIYHDWLLSQSLTGRIEHSAEILQAWRDPMQYDTFGAWVASEWAGHIKPSTDMLKQANGYKVAIDEGWSNNDLIAKELTGTKFRKNIKKLRRENEMKAEVQEILGAQEREAEHKNQLELVDNKSSGDDEGDLNVAT